MSTTTCWYLISGSNRGIGFGLVNEILKRSKQSKIIGLYRNRERSHDLINLAQNSNQRLNLIEFDLKNFDGYSSLGDQVKSLIGNYGLNVLINNAGIGSKFTRLGLVKYEQLMDSYAINTVAPILLAKTMLPHLKQAAKLNKDTLTAPKPSLIVNITSILGSIRENRTGGFYPYRCSKAALNMATKTTNVDLKADGIRSVAIHPGWVKTELGGFKNAPLEVQTSAFHLINLIEQLVDDTDYGKKADDKVSVFFNYDGTVIDY